LPLVLHRSPGVFRQKKAPPEGSALKIYKRLAYIRLLTVTRL